MKLERLSFRDRFGILSEKRLSGVAGLKYIRLYGKSQFRGEKMKLSPKSTLTTLILILLTAIITTPLYALTGQGTQTDPYRIQSLTDFNDFATDPNYWAQNIHTRLETNIDLSTKTYTTAVIAPDTNSIMRYFQGKPFSGIFDGNNHIISNLTINAPGTGNSYLGLFGKSAGAELKNIGIENINITSGDNSQEIGGLCGINSQGTIINCYTTGTITSGDSHAHLIGGLCGYNYFGTITNSYAATAITSGVFSSSLGGLCGINLKGTITNCYATGSVTSGNDSRNLGGLCGKNDSGNITNCYAIGPVTGDKELGGLCGINRNGDIINCYFYLLNGPDNTLGTALDDLQMLDVASYVGFDFTGNSNDGSDDYWSIANQHLPKLSWQKDDGPLVPIPPVTTLAGTGYYRDPYQINTHADFTEFRTNNNFRCGYYTLTTDINLAGETFTTAVVNSDFGGHFNGNGHVISNITIDTAGKDTDYLGLFSVILTSVSNLGIENFNIIAKGDSDSLGSLCGDNRGTIDNCYATASITATSTQYSYHLGGLCGENWGDITNCYATSSVTGGENSCDLGGLCGYNRGNITNCFSTGEVIGGKNSRGLGGLCGGNFDATISNCYSTASVTSGDKSAGIGGLCGGNGDAPNRNTVITNCYSTGSVTAGNNSEHIGGFCGDNQGTITNSYSIGSVTATGGSASLGGLCGSHRGSTAITTNCFWDVEISDMTTGYNLHPTYPGTITNVVGKTTKEMQTKTTFTDAGWDFIGEDDNGIDDFWRMYIDGFDYPELSWNTLTDAVAILLDPAAMKNPNQANVLLNKIDEVQKMIESGKYKPALNKLKNDILKKTDGCATKGQPDKNDWITTCDQQEKIYPLIIETVEYVETLIE